MIWLLDVLVFLILFVMTAIGMYRGFVRSITALLATVLALLLSVFISAPLAKATFNGWLAQPIEQAISDKLDVQSNQSLEVSLENTLDSMPDIVSNLLYSKFGSTQQMAQSIEASGELDQEQIGALLTRNWVAPLVIPVLQLLISVILFLILRIFLGVLLRIISKLFKLPVLKQLNRLLGAVVGFLQGVLLLLVVSAVLHGIALSNGPDSFLSVQNLEQTTVLHWIIEINPLSGI